MSRIARLSLVTVFGAAALLVASSAITQAFWFRCGPLDVHAWQKHFICWYATELIAVVAVLVGLVGGYIARVGGAVVLGLAALAALAAFRLQGGFPFGEVATAFVANGLLYLVLPSVIAGAIGSRVTRTRRNSAL